jgi:hypothetical protein
MEVANTLAYYDTTTITTVKRFCGKGPCKLALTDDAFSSETILNY